MQYLLIAARLGAKEVWRKQIPSCSATALDGWLNLDIARHFLETGSVRGRGAFPWEGPEAPQPLKRSGSQSFRSGSCEIQF